MNLEDYIRDNRDEFDCDEPSENHLENFSRKLKGNRRINSNFNFTSFLKIASIILLVIMSSLWILQNFIISDQPSSISKMNLSDLSRDYEEVEIYYTSGINSALSDLSNIGFEGEQVKNDILNNELSELDSLYGNLQEELALQPDDERIIDAMIEHYRTKLNIINNIIIQLKHVKNLKPENDETVEI